MPPVQLLQVTDTHLFGDESLELYDTNTAESLAAALRAAVPAGTPRPHAVLVTGDVAEDCSPAAYAHFRAALGTLGVPVYSLPGNHDSPALMTKMLGGAGFQYCGAADLGGWRLVLLDTHLDREPSGRLAPAELQRLDRELAAAVGRPVLVALHHPHVRAVVGGHVHQAVDRRRGELRLYATPSTCAQFKPGTPDCVMDDRPPGYRWLTLHADGAIDTRVGWADDWHRKAPPRDTRGPEPAGMG